MEDEVENFFQERAKRLAPYWLKVAPQDSSTCEEIEERIFKMLCGLKKKDLKDLLEILKEAYEYVDQLDMDKSLIPGALQCQGQPDGAGGNKTPAGPSQSKASKESPGQRAGGSETPTGPSQSKASKRSPGLFGSDVAGPSQRETPKTSKGQRPVLKDANPHKRKSDADPQSDDEEIAGPSQSKTPKTTPAGTKGVRIKIPDLKRGLDKTPKGKKRNWYIRAWLDRTFWRPGEEIQESDKSGEMKYWFRCQIKDDTECTINVAAFLKTKEKCQEILDTLKSSSREQTLCMRYLNVKSGKEQYRRPGEHMYELIIDENSMITFFE